MNSNDKTVYEIRFSGAAASYFSRLDKPTKRRISDALDQLAANPADTYFDVKPLTGRDGEYRLRVGKYRIIYTLDDGVLLIFVVTISPRGDVYKR